MINIKIYPLILNKWSLKMINIKIRSGRDVAVLNIFILVLTLLGNIGCVLLLGPDGLRKAEVADIGVSSVVWFVGVLVVAPLIENAIAIFLWGSLKLSVGDNRAELIVATLAAILHGGISARGAIVFVVAFALFFCICHGFRCRRQFVGSMRAYFETVLMHFLVNIGSVLFSAALAILSMKT